MKKINHLYANVTFDSDLLDEFLEESSSNPNEFEESKSDKYVLTTNEENETVSETYDLTGYSLQNQFVQGKMQLFKTELPYSSTNTLRVRKIQQRSTN